MSDSARMDMTDKAKSTLKPDSEKSTLEKGSDSLKSTADSAASSLQPDSEKSATQKAGDSLSSGSSSAQDQGSSLLGQAQEGLGNAAKSVQDTLGMGEKK